MHTFSEEIKDVSKKMNGENNTSFMFEIFFETPPYFQLEEVEELSKIIGLDQLFNHNIQEINLTKGLQYIERIYQKKIDMQEIKIKNYERFIQDLS
jgi:hypothetical protein